MVQGKVPKFVQSIFMNLEFQYISIQLLIKGLFLVFLVLLALQFSKEAKRMASFAWLMAATVFINILISIPLPFQYNAIGFSFMSTHVLAIMTINFLKILSIQFLPYEQPDRFVKTLKQPKVYLSIAGIFAAFVATIVVITGFGTLVDENKIFYVFVSIDAIASTVVNVVWAYYFYCSFRSVLKVKNIQVFVGILLLIHVLFYTLFFLKILALLPLPDSIWYRILSLVLYISQVVIIIAHLIAIHMQQGYKQDSTLPITDSERAELKAIRALQLIVSNQRTAMILTLELADGSQRNEEMILQKGLKPFAYWFQFALATKLGIQLTHSEISVIKYRMVEFWNKSMTLKINQDVLFTDTRIQYAFALPASEIEISFDRGLKDRSLYVNTFKEFYVDFYSLIKDKADHGGKKLQAEDAFDLVLNSFS